MVQITKIYKYQIPEAMPGEIEARVLKPLVVDFQDGIPVLWVMVNDDLPVRTLRIHRIGTGWPISDNLMISSYLNTTVMQSAPYVWHWFCEVL